MPTNNPADGQRSPVSLKIEDATKQRLNKIAYELSDPGSQVTVSHVIREAVNDYIEQYEDDPERCAPGERGSLGSDDSTEAEA